VPPSELNSTIGCYIRPLLLRHILKLQSNPLNVTTLNVTNRFMSQKFFSPASVHRN